MVPLEVCKMTFKEIYYMNKQIELEEALELDRQIKLVGDKKGYTKLNQILAKYKTIGETVNVAETNEATVKNVTLLDSITKQLELENK